MSSGQVLWILSALHFGVIHAGWTSEAASVVEAEKDEDWSTHFQASAVPQAHAGFSAPYTGKVSLSPHGELETSFTSTFYLGRRLWKGGELYINPELAAGSGISNSQGIAGFTNGEIYRVGDSKALRPYLSRLFVRQSFALGDEKEAIESDQNQIAGKKAVSRLTLTVGKFSLNDLLDNNVYSHEPRSQFLNWALMDNGAWDYAADTRGYTWGFAIELNQPRWAIRFASVLVPTSANQMELDTDIGKAHGDNLELEYRYRVAEHPGKARVLGYMNHARMGSYRDTTNNPALGLDVTRSRGYRTKFGAGINLEQEIAPDLGMFSRIGWDDGHTETWAFTEIDRTVSLGVSLKGTKWTRPNDTIGLAYIYNELSDDHRDYLAAGGVGFIVGDGRINYAAEQIVEGYYSFAVYGASSLSLDVQQVFNPAYNRDRGPVSVVSGRLHAEL